MLRVLNKSFFRRFVIEYLFLILSLVVLYYFAGDFLEQSFGIDAVFLGLMLLLFFAPVLLVFTLFISPLHAALAQIQALLAGKAYKKIYTQRYDEVGMIAHFFNRVTEGFDSLSSNIKDRRRMMDELAIASQLQKDILPVVSPFVAGLQVVAKTKPASELGGDSFNFISVENRHYIYVGDVTGHGAAAGLLMTMVHTLISVFAEQFSSPYDILVQVNRFIRRWIKQAMYMTLVMLCWDDKEKKLSYVGAGHEHILHYRVSTGEVEVIMSGGVAVGMVPDNTKLITEKGLVFDEGDVIVLYSDGITEAKNGNGEFYGLDRLKSALQEFAQQYSAEGINYHIAKDVVDYMGAANQADDMTLIVLKRDDSLTVSTSRDNEHFATSWR